MDLEQRLQLNTSNKISNIWSLDIQERICLKTSFKIKSWPQSSRMNSLPRSGLKLLLSMMIILWLLSYATPVTCPAGTGNPWPMIRYQHSYSGAANPSCYNVIRGSVSSDFYFLDYVGGTVLHRQRTDMSQVWAKSYGVNPSFEAFTCSNNEVYLYFVGYQEDRFNLYEINTSDGSVNRRIER